MKLLLFNIFLLIQTLILVNFVSTATVQDHDNSQNKQINRNNPKWLQIQRQIIMTEQMISLYQERLLVLKQLKQQIIKNQQQQQFQQSNEANGQHQKSNKQKVQKQNKFVKPNYKSSKGTKDLLFINQYQINEEQQKLNPERQTQDKNNQQKLVLVPPFIINLDKRYVTLIKQLQKHKLQEQNHSQQHNIDKNFLYQYGKNSNRLLFYSSQQKPSLNPSPSQKSINFNHKQFILNLALQIKPNKIKNVKITYKLILNYKASNQQESDQNSKSQTQQPIQFNKFFIEQTITSYQSHQLLSQNFKWHKALQFQDLLVGFKQQAVLIKSKDKRMHQINVKSKVRDIYSLNQYKLLFVTQKSIGTINVRSLAIMDQIKLQYYLGNRTLTEQKKNKQQIAKNQQSQNGDQSAQYEQQLLQSSLNSQNSNKTYFWHHPLKNKFFTNKVNILASYQIESTKQTIVLLSNADLLLYQKQRIIASINLGTELSKQFSIETTMTEKWNAQDLRINIELISPNFNSMLVYSNKHDKIGILNITIPNLSMIKGTGGWFSSEYKIATEFKGSYWQVLTFEQNQNTLSSPNSQKIFHPFIINKQALISLTYSQIYLQDYHKESRIQNKRNLASNVVLIYLLNRQTQNSNIKEYRVMLDLFGKGNEISSGWGSKGESSQYNKSEGKSYWWNILMVAMVILGVFVFRKFRKTNNQESYENGKHERDKFNKPLIGRNKSTKNPQTNNQASRLIPEQTKKSPLVNESIINELQAYLQKQGQQLTRQQLVQLAQQLQHEQQEESYANDSKDKNRKPNASTNKMRREEPSSSSNDNREKNIQDELQLKNRAPISKKKRD